MTDGTRPRVCEVVDCERKHYARGMCSLHYQRARAAGPLEALPEKPKECTFAGCERPVRSRGLCEVHRQQRDRGDNLTVLPPKLPPEQRFWLYVSPTDGCWIWAGHVNDAGYGRFNWNRTPKFAHRIAYELVKGEIPDGMQIDHVCRNPRCVHPNHLRLVTNKQNSENLGVQAGNTSGYRGVYWSRERKAWYASVTHNRKKYNLGRFDTAEEAHAVVSAWRRENFTHSIEN